MSSASISKIHVTNSTSLSLNDRFTAMASKTENRPVVAQRGRSRSRSRSILRKSPKVDRDTSIANRRLLQQLARKSKLQTAMKLKRRSIRSVGTSGFIMKRGSVKALRVAPNGRPIKANSLAKVATMQADLLTNGNRSSRPLRRANSTSNIAGRLGSRRANVGGAAERVARRQFDRFRNNNVIPRNGVQRRGRSRSRSRGPNPQAPRNVRGRSVSRGRVNSARRGRSRSRSRIGAAANFDVPVKARLGLRPGSAGTRRPRGRSVTRQGVAQGRVQKQDRPQRQGGRIVRGAGTKTVRPRGRSAVRNAGAQATNARSRSRSRSRKGAAVGRQQSGSVDQGRGRRGRSQQRRNSRGGGTSGQRNGKTMGTKNGQNTQQRRGRSRSRSGRGGRGGRNLGKSASKSPAQIKCGGVPAWQEGNTNWLKKNILHFIMTLSRFHFGFINMYLFISVIGNNGKSSNVDRDALDKELDQYMATTKTENNMDYLLKN